MIVHPHIQARHHRINIIAENVLFITFLVALSRNIEFNDILTHLLAYIVIIGTILAVI